MFQTYFKFLAWHDGKSLWSKCCQMWNNIIRQNCRKCTVLRAVIDGFMLSEKWNVCVFCLVIYGMCWVACAIPCNSGICSSANSPPPPFFGGGGPVCFQKLELLILRVFFYAWISNIILCHQVGIKVWIWMTGSTRLLECQEFEHISSVCLFTVNYLKLLLSNLLLLQLNNWHGAESSLTIGVYAGSQEIPYFCT